jgi:hypothetical protein
MQTPPSIKLYWLFIFIIFILKNLSYILLYFNYWINKYLKSISLNSINETLKLKKKY